MRSRNGEFDLDLDGLVTARGSEVAFTRQQKSRAGFVITGLNACLLLELHVVFAMKLLVTACVGVSWPILNDGKLV